MKNSAKNFAPSSLLPSFRGCAALLLALVLGAFSPTPKPTYIELGKGVYDLEIGKSKIKHVEQVMDYMYHTAVFDYHQSNQSLTTLDYRQQGLRFQFQGKNTRNQVLRYVYLEAPFRGITKKGIVLNKSTMGDVVNAYGEANWQLSGKDLYKSYQGIVFYVHTNKHLSFRDLEDKKWLDKQFLNTKVYKFILAPKHDH